MKIKIDKSNLVKVIQTVAKVASSKTTNPIINTIKFEADNDIIITAYSPIVSVVAHIEGDIEEKGSCLIDAKIISTILAKANNEVKLESNDKEVKLSSGRSRYKFLYMDPTLFPEIMCVNRDTKITIPGKIFKNAYKKIGCFIGKSTTNKQIEGMHLHIENNTVEFVGTDGYRLAVITADIDTDQTYDLTLPKEAIKAIISVIDDKDINIYIGNRNLGFEYDNYFVTCNKIDGQYLDYSAVINQCKAFSAPEVKINSGLFSATIDSATPVVDDYARTPVMMNFENNEVEISSSSSLGKMQTKCEINTEREPVKIAANAVFLKDALSAFDDNTEITVKINNAVSPIFMTNDEDISIVVLPMRTRAA